MAERIGPSGVLWSRPKAARPGGNLLVMLHGATSSERDPFDPLVPRLPENLIASSPRGPVAEGDGYSWVSPEKRASATTDRDVAAVGNEIARAVLDWLDTLPTFETIGILGASQGDSKPPVFWGRGDFDEVIHQDYTSRTAIWLRQHSTLTERIYEMGHNVCPAELDDVAGFVVEQIGDWTDRPRTIYIGDWKSLSTATEDHSL